MVCGRRWQNITRRFVFLRYNAALPGKQLLLFQRQQASPKHQYLFNDRKAWHARRNIPSSTQMWEPQILKYLLLVSCLEITDIYIGTIISILDTNEPFHYYTYYGSDLHVVYIVYSVCKSNNIDETMKKIHSHSKYSTAYAYKRMKKQRWRWWHWWIKAVEGWLRI